MNISELIGKTITEINGAYKDSECIYFTCSDGAEYQMYHSQVCCEDVSVEDVVGDINDLIDTPILDAEERINNDNCNYESCTWTFYSLRTIKGYVDIRWYGSSNGYYSESVNFV